MVDVLEPCPEAAATYAYVWPTERLSEMEPLVPAGVTLRPQRGSDLWERMERCFDELLETHDRVVLRNTDSPDLPADVVAAAIQAATKGKVVLGPDPGGGYYLIGLHAGTAEAARRALFGVAAEGGDTVWEATLAAATAAGLEVVVLGMHRDVDRIDDLLALWRARGGMDD